MCKLWGRGHTEVCKVPRVFQDTAKAGNRLKAGIVSRRCSLRPLGVRLGLQRGQVRTDCQVTRCRDDPQSLFPEKAAVNGAGAGDSSKS